MKSVEVIKKEIVIDKKTIEQLQQQSQEENQTVIHCTYVSKFYYVNGGWVNIHPTTFLVNEGTRLPLLYTDNIPVAPKMHFFSKAGETKKFTLFFSGIPKNWETFDFVEETKNSTGFVVKNISRNESGVYQIQLI